jgi:hypothetical protein
MHVHSGAFLRISPVTEGDVHEAFDYGQSGVPRPDYLWWWRIGRHHATGHRHAARRCGGYRRHAHQFRGTTRRDGRARSARHFGTAFTAGGYRAGRRHIQRHQRGRLWSGNARSRSTDSRDISRTNRLMAVPHLQREGVVDEYQRRNLRHHRGLEIDLVHGLRTSSPSADRDTHGQSLPFGSVAGSSLLTQGNDPSLPNCRHRRIVLTLVQCCRSSRRPWHRSGTETLRGAPLRCSNGPTCRNASGRSSSTRFRVRAQLIATCFGVDGLAGSAAMPRCAGVTAKELPDPAAGHQRLRGR